MYLLSNDTKGNFVHHDHDHDHENDHDHDHDHDHENDHDHDHDHDHAIFVKVTQFEKLVSENGERWRKKCTNTTFIEVDFRNRKRQLQILYAVEHNDITSNVIIGDLYINFQGQTLETLVFRKRL